MRCFFWALGLFGLPTMNLDLVDVLPAFVRLLNWTLPLEHFYPDEFPRLPNGRATHKCFTRNLSRNNRIVSER
jgi:hypothetical protein